VVVVLGQVGDQFAVGMQGGAAFVLDTDDQFPQSVSSQKVLVESITNGTDTEFLKYLLTRHVRLTGSIRGQEILDDWLNQMERFWKIVPQSINSMPLSRVVPDMQRR
jgi:glutamate synthase domain-containing protein 3